MPIPARNRSKRPAAEAATRPEAILAGAAAVFSAKGFAAASMREVASAAGSSLGSIYHHFESKEDILRAILTGNFRRVMDASEQRLRDVDDPREALVAFIENHVAFFVQHLDVMRVMSHELDTLKGSAGAEVVKLRRAYTLRARNLIARCKPELARSTRAEDLQIATLSLFGMLNWTYRWFHTLPDETQRDPRRLARRMSRLFLDGLLGA